MNLVSKFLVWSWLLCIGLVAPASLPAGGAQKSIIQQRKSNIGSPVIAFKEFNLLSSASSDSNVLTNVKAGTPIHVLKVWDGIDNGKWLLVNVMCENFNQFFYKRGWVNIAEI